MLVYLMCSTLIVFAPNPILKSVGYFFQGILHLKIPLSFTHLFELSPEEKKSICSILISSIDNFTLAYFSLFLLFITRDADRIIKTVYLIEAVAIFLYLAIAPESPAWCLLNHRFEEAVDNLNYISKANGNKPVLSPNSKVEMLGQTFEQNKIAQSINPQMFRNSLFANLSTGGFELSIK